jgi:hypothetical protein
MMDIIFIHVFFQTKIHGIYISTNIFKLVFPRLFPKRLLIVLKVAAEDKKFCDNIYSNQMVNPKVWGDSGWRFLIACAADYADNPGIQIQHNYQRFFLHLKWVLPCETCRSNYEEHWRRWPIDQYLKSRAALFRWIMINYNDVQIRLNKKTKSPQELLYELFGPEEGERMMQRLVYEDPEANITVIKPFDPTISQYGGQIPTSPTVVTPTATVTPTNAVTSTVGVPVNTTVTTVTPTNVVTAYGSTILPEDTLVINRTGVMYPSALADMQIKRSITDNTLIWVIVLLLILLGAYALFNRRA